MSRVLKALEISVLSILGLTVFSGCSEVVLSNKWAREVSKPDEWPLADAKDDMWLKKVDSLPLELHFSDRDSSGGKGPSLSNYNILPHRVLAGSDKDSATAQQRIVLYIDGDNIPIRDNFCSVNKEFRKVDVVSNSITLRAALCDGPRILTYGRKELPINRLEPKKIDSEIVSLSHSLVGALYPALTMEQQLIIQDGGTLDHP